MNNRERQGKPSECLESTPPPVRATAPASVSVHLPVGVGAHQRRLELLHAHGVLEPEMAAARPPEPAAEPRRGAHHQAEDAADGEEGVLRKGDAHVEEDLLEARDGELGLDLGRRGRDLVDRLRDRGPRGKDGIARNGLIPVLPVLLFVSGDSWAREWACLRLRR